MLIGAEVMSRPPLVLDSERLDDGSIGFEEPSPQWIEGERCVCELVSSWFGVASRIQYGEVADIAKLGFVSVPDDEKIRVFLLSKQRKSRFRVFVAVCQCDTNPFVLDGPCCREALCERCIIVAGDASESRAFGLERVENGFGGEITRMKHEIGLTDGGERVIVESVRVAAVGVGNDGDHREMI